MSRNLFDLKNIALGGIPVKKEIEIDGEKIEVYVKKVSYSALEENRKQSEISFSDFLIANSIVDENSKPIFSLEEIKSGLIIEYYNALVAIATEVSLGKILNKQNSTKPTKSGSN